VLELREWPSPDLRPHDLIVEVRAAGMNRADLSYRKGAYGRASFGDSDLMGLEIAGDVIELGKEVRGFSKGDRVMGIVGGGGYAERARIDYRMAMRIPETLDYVQAAAVPEAFITAHESLFHLGRLDSGESVLIHAAASGVGSAAVQLAHLAGATIYATADDAKLDQVRQLGADVTIAYKTNNFARAVIEGSKGRGVDVILDSSAQPILNAISHVSRLVVGLYKLGYSAASKALGCRLTVSFISISKLSEPS
jgi:NADPH:quinone reductase